MNADDRQFISTALESLAKHCATDVRKSIRKGRVGKLVTKQIEKIARLRRLSVAILEVRA